MEKAIDMALDGLTDAMAIVSPLLAKSAIVIMNDALHKAEGNL